MKEISRMRMNTSRRQLRLQLISKNRKPLHKQQIVYFPYYCIYIIHAVFIVVCVKELDFYSAVIPSLSFSAKSNLGRYDNIFANSISKIN
jgi:hypothetical protein